VPVVQSFFHTEEAYSMTSKILTLAIALFAAPLAHAQRPETGNSSVIIVTGESEVLAVPDEATVRMGVVRQAPTAQAAQDQANTAAAEIIAAVTRLGIPANDIQSSRITLTPIYADRNSESGRPPRIAAYQASNIISVRLSDLGKIGPTIDVGLKASANEIQGVQFRLRNDLPVRQQALKQAVNEAQKKAQAIAEAASVTLGMPMEITENTVSMMPRDMYTLSVRAAEMAAPPSTPVSPGQLEIRANVTIRYRIGGH
jgi:uncharacterized protein YggE